MYFKPRTKMDRTPLRSVTSQHIGCLVKLRVRQSEELVTTSTSVNAYTVCGVLTPDVIILFSSLICPQGVVTHVTDVKPLVEVVTYTDQQNGNEVYQEVGT